MEETITEDLSDIKDPVSVTPIDDWEKRFRLANYTSDQKRIVNLAQDKMAEWLDTFRKTDWTTQQDKDGLLVEYRNSHRGFNTFKASSVLPFKNIHVFRTLNASYLRQSYDVNINKTETVNRICANVTTIYQLSKKVMVVSPRDFVLINYFHLVSLKKLINNLCLVP